MVSSLHLVINLLLVCNCAASYRDVMTYAFNQYSIIYSQFLNDSHRYYPSDGSPFHEFWDTTTAVTGWTSGFFPGVLWNLFEYTSSLQTFQMATDVTEPTAPFANITNTHDVGFVIMCGFGNGYRLLKMQGYDQIIITGAHSLATRYSPIVRCIRSHDTPTGYVVIIDNMMNLELLFEGSILAKNQTLFDIAWQHANRTMYEHFRSDNSTYHVVVYNETNGNVMFKGTGQGYANWSTWSRGQAWAVYGFTMSYRYSRYQPFLDKAIGAASYYLTRLSKSTDYVPYWDLDAPYNSTIPYQPRDTSAGAIFASALVELSQYVNDSEIKNRFLTGAKTIVDQLTTSRFLISGNPNYKLPAIMANGTLGPYPSRPFDVALSFGDYYLTQTIVRLSKLE